MLDTGAPRPRRRLRERHRCRSRRHARTAGHPFRGRDDRSWSTERLWGAMIASSRRPEPMPAGTESWIEEFTELVATAIANIQARSELAASRARIVAATDEERRRVVRDLHDGAQQRLVHTVITLKLARPGARGRAAERPGLVTEALGQAQQANVELRELAHGILPSVLTHGGLRAGVEALASRAPVVVEQDVSVGRLAGRCRGDRLLRGRRGFDQRRQVRPGQASRASRRALRTARFGSRCATTGWAAPDRMAAVCWASAIGSPPSMAGSGSRARPRAARSSPPTSPSPVHELRFSSGQ